LAKNRWLSRKRIIGAAYNKEKDNNRTRIFPKSHHLNKNKIRVNLITLNILIN